MRLYVDDTDVLRFSSSLDMGSVVFERGRGCHLYHDGYPVEWPGNLIPMPEGVSVITSPEDLMVSYVRVTKTTTLRPVGSGWVETSTLSVSQLNREEINREPPMRRRAASSQRRGDPADAYAGDPQHRPGRTGSGSGPTISSDWVLRRDQELRQSLALAQAQALFPIHSLRIDPAFVEELRNTPALMEGLKKATPETPSRRTLWDHLNEDEA